MTPKELVSDLESTEGKKKVCRIVYRVQIMTKKQMAKVVTQSDQVQKGQKYRYMEEMLNEHMQLLECVLCGDANSRRLKRQSCCG